MQLAKKGVLLIRTFEEKKYKLEFTLTTMQKIVTLSLKNTMYATTLLFDYRNAFECQLRMDDCAAARSYTPISIPIEFETERKTTYNKYKTTFPSKCLVILSI